MSKVITRDKVIEKVTAPDGTITERTTTRESDSTPTFASLLPSYRAGFSVNPMNPKGDQRVAVGARLGKLPLWLEIGMRIGERAFDVGLSFEF